MSTGTEVAELADPVSALAVVPPRPRGLSVATVNEALELAKHLSESGMVPKDYVGKPGAIVASIDLGLSVGLSAMQALQGIANINGRPSLWGDAALAVVMAHPDFYDLDEDPPEVAITTGGRCKITRRRKDGTAKTTERRFTSADAQRAGLIGKAGPWTTATGRMYQMRARAFAMRDAFPDALKGMAVAEEAQDFEIIPTGTPGTDLMQPKSKSGAPAPGPAQSAPTAAQAAGATPVNGNGIAATVLDVNDRPAGNGTLHTIRIRNAAGGEAYDVTTFSDSLAGMARDLCGQLAYVEITPNTKNGKTYHNLTAIEPAGREPGAEG